MGRRHAQPRKFKRAGFCCAQNKRAIDVARVRQKKETGDWWSNILYAHCSNMEGAHEDPNQYTLADYETMMVSQFLHLCILRMRKDVSNPDRVWSKVLSGQIFYRKVKMENFFGPTLAKYFGIQNIPLRSISQSSLKPSTSVFKAIFNDMKTLQTFLDRLPGTDNYLWLSCGIDSCCFVMPKAEINDIFDEQSFKQFEQIYSMQGWKPIYFVSKVSLGRGFLRVYTGAVNPQVFVLSIAELHIRGQLERFYEIFSPCALDSLQTVTEKVSLRGQKGWIHAKWVSIKTARNPVLRYVKGFEEPKTLLFHFHPSQAVNGIVQMTLLPGANEASDGEDSGGEEGPGHNANSDSEGEVESCNYDDDLPGQTIAPHGPLHAANEVVPPDGYLLYRTPPSWLQVNGGGLYNRLLMFHFTQGWHQIHLYHFCNMEERHRWDHSYQYWYSLGPSKKHQQRLGIELDIAKYSVDSTDGVGSWCVLASL